MKDGTPISKSQRKREVAALQELGAALVAISEERLAAIELPERLRDAVIAARHITRFEARRRQLQYIGKLMRGVDPGPIRAQLEAWRAQARVEVALMKRAEFWRERLLAEEAALAELLREHPAADAQRLRALVRNAHRERAEGRPPRAFRELYRALRALLERT
ncbi:MAG TPA: ribosome biogenesis factor YjgA [Burkholderiales bacterium]|nr:ribosome biogenesis factor YjgA [Burkholderiales bacterium]